MSAKNTLVQLDSDETSETIKNHINTNGHIATEQNRVFKSQHTIDVLASNVYDHTNSFNNNISAPLLSTIKQ